MKINTIVKTKYGVKSTSGFKKDLKKAYKQGKDIDKLNIIVKKLANGEVLDEKYKNHNLVDDKKYKGCQECHIEPVLLINTGSHSNLFNK